MAKILIVDDEVNLLRILEKGFARAGYEVFTATSGKQAIELTKGVLPHLIILDIVLPDIDGGEVAQLLKNDPRTKDIPVIFLTALYTKKDESKEGHVVADRVFVAKPFQFSELLKMVEDYTRR